MANKCDTNNNKDPVVIAFRKWQDAAQFVPFASEQLVFSLEYVYAGTADLIGAVNGRLSLLDIKSCRGVYPEYKLHLAAYAVAGRRRKAVFPKCA